MPDGRCNCASIKVSIPALPEKSTICYCANCRRAGGSIGSVVYMFEEADVQISDPDGKLKSYKDNDTKSGKPVTRQFCGNCGCPIASVLSNSSKLFLKGGLFDHIPAPSFKSFEQDEPEWLKC